MAISGTSLKAGVDTAVSRGAPPRSPARPPQTERPKRLRILLVEDDEGDAYLIQQALYNNPRVEEVILAENGVDALKLIASGGLKPDLAFIDLHMPRKDGFALLGDFIGLKGDSFPAVVLTSSRLKADVARAQTRGAIGFVTKPFSQAKLREALNREIARV